MVTLEQHGKIWPIFKTKQLKDQTITKTFCNQNGWGFVKHLNIDDTCVNNYKLHLNKKGTAIIFSEQFLIDNIIVNSSTQISAVDLKWLVWISPVFWNILMNFAFF